MEYFTFIVRGKMSKIWEKVNEKGKVFCRFDRKKKEGYYLILSGFSQHKYCEKIEFDGFERLPSGFYTNDGYGLTRSGSFLLQELYARYDKKISLKIVARGKSKLDGRGKRTSVTLRHDELMSINSTVTATKRIRNEEIRADVRQFLWEQFSRQFKDYKGTTPDYAPGVLAEILDKKGLVKRLNDEDRERLENFIPEYLSNIPGTLRAKKKLRVVFDSLDAGKKVYFEKIIKEFKRKLKRHVQNEAIWQKFLSDYILLFRNSYGEVLEKESVSLEGRFPDFMLIDSYSYLNIYEIKKPTTTLLRYDKSRNNYYWDAEISKAISQVENYLHQVQRHSDSLINDIRRNKGIEVNIVRPRGYIIAGMRKQLKNDKMLDDFRILNESLKNIDIIFYDDLVNNLEAFVKRVGK